MNRLHSQKLYLGRRKKDFAERAHPVAVLFRFHAALAVSIELIETAEFDLELQRSAAMAARQWHQQTGSQLFALGGFDLAMDEIDRALAIDWQYSIREASNIHVTSPCRTSAPPLPGVGRDNL